MVPKPRDKMTVPELRALDERARVDDIQWALSNLGSQLMSQAAKQYGIEYARHRITTEKMNPDLPAMNVLSPRAMEIIRENVDRILDLNSDQARPG